jgi:hypothetical protein
VRDYLKKAEEMMPPWLRDVGRKVLRRTTAERTIRATYRRHYGKSLDVNNPQTFSEKLTCRMIALERSSDLTLTPLADKYRVRDYVRKRIGPEHLVRLLWQGTDPEQIPFDSLPAPYVIKTNHGSGGHIFVRDRVDRLQIIPRLRAALHENYYWRAREFQYLHIKPRVLIEEIVDDGVAAGPLDYRCWCFHGEVRLIQVDNHDHSVLSFYDKQWRQLDLRHRLAGANTHGVPEPGNLAELIEVAHALARGFDFVRVDLYNAHGRIYFGEMTFTPRAGLYTFQPESWDSTIGAWW